jgi:hypothetical protein
VSRGRLSVIRDPAIASAAAKCWLARWHKGTGARLVGIPITSFHPQDCGFCEYPADRLVESIGEFIEWAGLKPPTSIGEPTAMRGEVEMFLTLPSHEQKRLVEKAQGYLDMDDDDE